MNNKMTNKELIRQAIATLSTNMNYLHMFDISEIEDFEKRLKNIVKHAKERAIENKCPECGCGSYRHESGTWTCLSPICTYESSDEPDSKAMIS